MSDLRDDSIEGGNSFSSMRAQLLDDIERLALTVADDTLDRDSDVKAAAGICEAVARLKGKPAPEVDLKKLKAKCPKCGSDLIDFCVETTTIVSAKKVKGEWVDINYEVSEAQLDWAYEVKCGSCDEVLFTKEAE